jgi:hypothetical protein
MIMAAGKAAYHYLSVVAMVAGPALWWPIQYGYGGMIVWWGWVGMMVASGDILQPTLK